MGLLDSITGGGGNENKEENSGGGLMGSLMGDEGEDSSTQLLDDGTGSDSSTSSKNSSISRIPITDPEEAMDFAKTEWNKIRRTSGHSLEVQVFGSEHWEVGEWCKVYMPSLNEYTDMYITKVDNSNDSGSEWLTSLTLMDYAPQLSELDEESVKEQQSTSTDNSQGNSEDGQDSAWTQIAQVLQDNYEKPSDGWDNHIRAVQNAKSYDPDIKKAISSLKKKNDRSYVDVGHELCKIVGISY